MKAIIELNIDEKELLKISEEIDIKQALMKETGWLEQSGMTLSKIIEIQD